ncbi:MAG: alpha/beta fold hydrolase [Gallionella sp.]|nr:alpha/beta fold hydrolase [Gallionella sp.]MCK9352532.1 alpha/beta fold hydrolase [Gallionella sp.]
MKTTTNGEAKLEARHRPSGENSHFTGDGLPFGEYVRRTTAMLRRVHAGVPELEKIVAGNAPFELFPAGEDCRGEHKPYRRGVLLTHGLTDSPYFMRPLAEFFAQNGFRVMVILLPGHGTRPGDLLNVRWQEWAKAVAYGAERLVEEVDELYLAGFSAGGTLSIFQSLCDTRVRGLFLFSPALKISPRARWANLHRLYSWLAPSKKWVGIRPDRSLHKYESLPKNAAAQMHALTQELNSLLQVHETAVPVFAAASQDDTTANTPATLEFMAHASHPSNKLVLYTTDTKKIPPGISAEKLELVNSALPEQGILSSAHTAIVLPPDDAHYGADGDYCNAIHYYPGDMEKYEACNNGHGSVMLGEVTETNLKAGILRRLMYNPNFAALKVSMKRFIEALP